MKRASVAERTLTKQINILNEKIENLQTQINSLLNSKNATIAIRDQLAEEVRKLYAARITASERVNP